MYRWVVVTFFILFFFPSLNSLSPLKHSLREVNQTQSQRSCFPSYVETRPIS
jgi:hypothetical protein